MRPDRVDVPLHEVAAEAAVGAQRPLEVDERAACQGAERRDAQRLGPDVGVNLAASASDHRQADAVDRQAVAEASARRRAATRSASRRPPVVGLRSTTSPTASTRPVNISFDQHIGSERLDAPLEQAPRSKTGRPSRNGTPPAPSTCGVTYSRTKSTTPSSHAAACSAAPPSSSSELMSRSPRHCERRARSCRRAATAISRAPRLERAAHVCALAAPAPSSR